MTCKVFQRLALLLKKQHALNRYICLSLPALRTLDLRSIKSWILIQKGLFSNNNEKFRSFMNKENIHKKEVGPYCGSGYISLISDPINLAKGAREKYCMFDNFNMAVVSKTDISRKIPKYFKFVKKMHLNV